MSFFNKNKICVTHDGAFHVDDLFATAVLSVLNKGNIKIIRTRDPEIMKKADYLYDVGAEYDEGKNLFDHHQKGGAGVRANGISYSSFGLVWKKYGEQICGSREVAYRVDCKIVQPIDAVDNGQDIVKPIYENIYPYSVGAIFLSENPTWKEEGKNIDDIFKMQVRKASSLLSREIELAKSDLEAREIIMEAYNKMEDKRIIVSEKSFPRYIFQRVLSALPEPVYWVSPSHKDEQWKVEAIAQNPGTMESRKLFPESWRGLREVDSNIEEVTGVSDLIFCHKSGFLLHTVSRDSSMKLAQKALIE